jgi:drug/metabolite transporter (DMT)-like permease
LKPALGPFFQIQFAVALFGVAGLFGRWLHLDPLLIVHGRVFFAAFSLGLVLYFKKESIRLKSSKDQILSLLLGIILAFHWYAFFRAVQETSIALALLSFASFPLFTLLLEALIFRVKLGIIELSLVLTSIIGTFILIPWDIQSPELTGVLWGLASGFSFALLAVFNKSLVDRYVPLKIAFLQNAWATLVLVPFTVKMDLTLSAEEWSLLILLGTVFTALSHSLFIGSLRFIKAQTASLIATLEPIYGIIAAYFFFREIPNLKTMVGGILILGVAIIAQSRERKSSS